MVPQTRPSPTGAVDEGLAVPVLVVEEAGFVVDVAGFVVVTPVQVCTYPHISQHHILYVLETADSL